MNDWDIIEAGIVHEVSGDPGMEWCFSCHASLAECSGPGALAALSRLRTHISELEEMQRRTGAAFAALAKEER